MKSLWRIMPVLLLGSWALSAHNQLHMRIFQLEAFDARPVSSVTEPGLRYVPGSTIKVEQLLGEEDKQLHREPLRRAS